jgi:serine protease Do
MLILASIIEAAAPPVEPKIILPAALDKSAPEDVADLKAIQEQVKTVLKKAMPATVAIVIPEPSGRGMAAGSGVIISESGFVLTAGHISQKPNQKCTLILPDGKRLNGETLGWNRSRDAGLIRITSKGKWPHAEMGDSGKLKPGQWCLTVGHPGGYKPGRTPVVRLGRILSANRSWLQTDTPLVGGDSGGPLFDLTGKVIGIHSWISRSISGNMHVPVNTYRNDWDRLAKAEVWGTMMGGGPPQRPTSSAYMGVVFSSETDDLVISEITVKTPAEKAGLRKGDVLVRIDDRKLESRPDLSRYLRRKKPGEEVEVEVERDGKPVIVKMKLIQRPEE